MKSKLPTHRNQEGMASFLVVTIIVTLLALVSVGFSHLSNREANQALNRQLSDVAYYAAEAGVNDARAYIAANLGNPTGVPPLSDCKLPSSATQFPANGSLSGTGNVIRYSCLLINPTPTQLTYQLAAGQTVSFLINVNPLHHMYFSWQNQCYYPQLNQQCTGTKNPLGSYKSLPQENSTLGVNATGLLRASFYPVANSAGQGGHDTNKDLTKAARTYFMYPNSGAGSLSPVDYAAGDYNTVDTPPVGPTGTNGSFVPGNCNDTTKPLLPDGTHMPYYCNTKLDGIPNGPSYYYVSLTAQYKPLIISLWASKANGMGEQLQPIPGVEAIVDSTGVGNDVLRRIRAVVPLNINTTLPNDALNSMQGICKLFRVSVTSLGQYGPVGAQLPAQLDSGATAANGDGMCSVPSFSSGAIDSSGGP